MIKKFDNFVNENSQLRRFPLNCSYNSSVFPYGDGTSMIRLEMKDGNEKDFDSDINLLNGIDFLTVNAEKENNVIEIIISKEASQRLLEYYLMVVKK